MAREREAEDEEEDGSEAVPGGRERNGCKRCSPRGRRERKETKRESGRGGRRRARSERVQGERKGGVWEGGKS